MKVHLSSGLIGPVILAVSLPPLIFWGLCTLYLLGLAFAAVVRRRRVDQSSETLRSFCLMIPAHNESMNLGSVLERLSSIDYPKDKLTTVVIADNCSDNTADIARQFGVTVLERHHEELRGKGYALEWAINQLLDDPRAFDAFVIMDADSVLSSNFFHTMNAGLANGHQVLQGYYGVLNTGDTWRTRLMAVALALAHYVKPLGRMALKLSDGLKGNGMVFSRSALVAVPWSGESVTEDIDHTLRLMDAGIRIEFVPNATVEAQMPTTGDQAASQRQRWEGGRYGLLKRAFTLLFKSVTKLDRVAADRAIELIIPPFAELFAVPVLFLGITGVGILLNPSVAILTTLLRLWLLILLGETAYLILGIVIAKVPFKTYSSLLFAPFYILWKIVVVGSLAVNKGVGGWRRTERRTL